MPPKTARMYEPMANGKLFNFDSAPNRYCLGPFHEPHVWAWKKEPDRHLRRHEPERVVRCDEDGRLNRDCRHAPVFPV